MVENGFCKSSPLIVPSAVPRAIVLKLNAAFNQALSMESVRERMLLLGVQPVLGGTPEQFAEHIRRETAKYADVVKRAGVKPD